MATQAKLPGTLPTHAQAKANLRDARSLESTRAKVVEGLKGKVKLAQKEQAAAELDRDIAERDLEASAAGSDEERDADVRQFEADKRVERAERDLGKVKEALAVAVVEHADAARALSGARGDLRAIHQGRRK